MAIVNQILHRKNTSGSYDTVYLQSNLGNVTGTLAIANGGTGATSAAAARTNLGINMSNYYTKAEVDKLLERTRWILGATIQWDNKSWLVCHVDYSVGYYLIAKDVISKTAFGSNDQYAGSTLASVAASYQSNNMSAAALAECVNVTVNGVTAKVFVPSASQMDGGFSWFSSNTSRIAYYNGTATNYWTSSPYGRDGYVRLVYYYGSVGDVDGNPSNSFGFRPCVCVQM